MEKGWGIDLENSDRVGFFGGYNNRISTVDSSGRGEVLGEVDFFSEKKEGVKKEITDLDVNVSLNTSNIVLCYV